MMSEVSNNHQETQILKTTENSIDYLREINRSIELWNQKLELV